MNPIEFADKYLYPYKVSGQEIKAKHCPICHGGASRDRDTFAINADNMTFNCKRGSCGVKGTFNELLKQFDENTFNEHYRIFNFTKAPKQYKKPQVKSEKVVETDPIIKWFESRGISKETVKARKIGKTKQGAIMFPYFKNGELVLVKYRTIDKKFWRTTDSEPVFWGLDSITDFSKPLVIVEGEMDALTLDECGVQNVVSVPSGSEDLECVENQWDTLEKFNSIIIWNDQDDAGVEMKNKLISRLGEDRCKFIECEHKDANEVLIKCGKEKVLQTLKSAKQVPIEFAVTMSSLPEYDPDKDQFVRSGIKEIDESLGGFCLGGVVITSGKGGSGKSTAINLFIAEATNQGYKTMVFSGETKSDILRYQIELVLAGDKNIIKKQKQGETAKYYIKQEVRAKMRNWYDDKIWVYDNITSPCGPNDMLKNMRTLYRRHNVQHFIIDNIMAMTWDAKNEWEMLKMQSDFIRDCIVFARKYNVAINVVQHPVKVEGRITYDHIRGTGDITNRAHGVILVHKMTNEDRARYAKILGETIQAISWNVDIEIAKNRHNGKTPTCNIHYDESSRRLKGKGDDMYRAFGWEESED